MTFKTTVKDQDGRPVENAFVVANVEETGATFTRLTDGNGYADVAILTPVPAGNHITFVVEADGFKRNAQYLSAGATDQTIEITLVPFV